MRLGTTNFQGKEYEIRRWDGENLGRVVAIDTETDVVPFHMTPQIATLQAFSGGDIAYYVPMESLEAFLVKHSSSFLVMQNAPFDMDVLAKEVGSTNWLYRMYDNCLVRDTGVLYRLWHLAHIGFVPMKYNLNLMSEKFLGVSLDKEGEERVNFFQFRNKPLTTIPEAFLGYGAKDVIATFFIYQRLLGMIQPLDTYGTLLSHDIQVKGDIALNHIRKNGIGFSLEDRDAWMVEVDAQMKREENVLATWGWVRGSKGIKERYELIMKRLGIADLLPRTKDGSVSQKAEDLEPYAHLPFISSYLKYLELEKASSFVNKIESSRVHPRYNLLVNTGRTSCSSPNFQQLPRAGGIRQMFQASEGNTFIITDYSAIELATLAQVTYRRYGHSVMRNQINDGQDLHKYYASVMHNCEIKDVTKQWRQEAKAANFGFPGGLGTETFIEFSRGYGLDITQNEAKRMKDVWFSAFPEVREYMKDEEGSVYTLTGRKRNNTSYCAEKNTPFQGLASDGAKLALYNLDKKGFKVVGFVHDEIICEVTEKSADHKKEVMEKIMIDSMREVVPDVRVSVESEISREYTK
jgi:DNA polymerase I-like protein with 3'-5' exonuclease and polymerase domains